MEFGISLLKAFLVGGAFCLVAQLLIDVTALTPARILTLYVVSGVALTALGCYEPLVNYAGCGATVPLTGFGYTLASGVKEGIEKFGFLGILSGLGGAAIGVSAALLFGFLAALLGVPKAK